jgi:hypothetical protein
MQEFGLSPWEFGWDALVAIGTLSLGLFTALLALRTSNLASETKDLAAATERMANLTEQDVAIASNAIAAGVRPVLIAAPRNTFMHPEHRNYDVPVPGLNLVRGHPDRAIVRVEPVDDVGGRVFISVPFRNEGAGIAFVRTASVSFHFEQWQSEGNDEANISSRQVPPHEFTRVSFLLPLGGNAPTIDDLRNAEAGSVWADITYGDLAGNIWRSRLIVAPDAHNRNDWSVTGYSVHSEGRVDNVAA